MKRVSKEGSVQYVTERWDGKKMKYCNKCGSMVVLLTPEQTREFFSTLSLAQYRYCPKCKESTDDWHEFNKGKGRSVDVKSNYT